MSDVFQFRSYLRQVVDNFFQCRDYLLVETPILVHVPGAEVYLDYFYTNWDDIRGKTHQRFLRSSPELHMKRALATGHPKVYQVAQSFRNGGEFSRWHHPEFTMLEWYQAGITFEDFLQETLDLLHFTWQAFQTKGWTKSSKPKNVHKLTIKQAFLDFAEIDLEDQDPYLAAKGKNAQVISVKSSDDFETAYFKILIEKIEPQLKKLECVVLYDFPPSQAALSRVENGHAKRFEIYWHGVEICNAFEELVGKQANQERFNAIDAKRQDLNKQPVPFDETFLDSCNNLPASCGNALGYDRWLACLLGETGIDQVIPFRSDWPGEPHG